MKLSTHINGLLVIAYKPWDDPHSHFLIGLTCILLAGTESGQAKIDPSTPVLDPIGAVGGAKIGLV